MESLNRMAIELVDEAIDFADELAVAAHELDNGATVLDFGVEVRGGVEAGLLYAEIASAGLATVQHRMDEVAGTPRAHVELATDHPALALLGSMRGGWELAVDGFEGLASGPARAAVAEEAVFERLGYAEHPEFAVLTVEADELPTGAVADAVAERTGLAPSDVFLVTAPAASPTGAVAAAARAAEITCGRALDLGVDPAVLESVVADAPVPPVAADEPAAIARGTDAVAYGGRVHLAGATGLSAALDDAGERGGDDEGEQTNGDGSGVDALASSAADRYGAPFADIFASVDEAYGEVDPAAFGPAAVTVDARGEPTLTAGERREDLLAESFAV